MIDVPKLKGKMAEKGMTHQRVASALGITPKTFGSRLKSGIFKSNEIEALIELLEIDSPMDIFFKKKVI